MGLDLGSRKVGTCKPSLPAEFQWVTSCWRRARKARWAAVLATPGVRPVSVAGPFDFPALPRSILFALALPRGMTQSGIYIHPADGPRTPAPMQAMPWLPTSPGGH